MTYHYLTLDIDGGYCIPHLICTAPPGASCHWWRDLDDELTEHAGCWAASWVEAADLDGFELDDLLKLPVEVIAQGEESEPLLRVLPGPQLTYGQLVEIRAVLAVHQPPQPRLLDAVEAAIEAHPERARESPRRR